MKRYLFHPGDRELAAFAESGDAARSEMRSHLASCQRCRSTITFQRELRAAAGALGASQPPAGLFDRVLEGRARGDRFIMPTAVLRPDRPFPRRRLAAAAALVAIAGSAAVVMRQPFGAGFQRTLATSRDSAPSDASGPDVFVSGGSLIRTAEAGELPRRSQPAAPPLTGIDGSRLRRGRLQFAQRWTDSTGHQRIDSRGTFDVAPATMNGEPVWRVASSWTGTIGAYGERLEAETLFIARSDLHLLARAVHAAPYLRYSRIDIAQQIQGDSVLGRMTAEQSGNTVVTRPIAQRLPVAFAPFISETLAPLMLTTVTLTPGWRRSLSLLGWAVRADDLFTSLELRVVGEEHVTVPAGRFDCWRLELVTGTHHIGYWVRKSDGIGILTRDDSKRATRGVREVILTGE